MSAVDVNQAPATSLGRVRVGTAAPVRDSLWTRIWRDRIMLLLITPGVLFFVLFRYLPLLGNIIAFEDYLPFLGFWDSPFVGFANFQSMFSDNAFWQALSNTIIITMAQLIFYFPAPIILALLMQGIISTKVRRIIQSVVYLPHFISWVIVVSLWQQVLGGSGIFVHTLRDVGLPALNIMTEPALFKPLVVAQLIWKESGYATIIFLAALLNIEASLYEAAVVDGAGRWQRLVNITLPGIMGVVILLLILRLGLALSVGFEQILLQRNAVGPAAGEVLDTYVYFKGIVGGQWGITAAAGLIKGIVGTLLVIGANKLAHRAGQEGVYS
ncbi:MAG TPA: ABC transporter permease subunit [Chloroflexota bacterium]|jgi:putative aldouronate transport system permease protein|nr:ABC transporter permease subunit [Chloroflexota bacterium]